jgi:hypothetical protein
MNRFLRQIGARARYSSQQARQRLARLVGRRASGTGRRAAGVQPG